MPVHRGYAVGIQVAMPPQLRTSQGNIQANSLQDILTAAACTVQIVMQNLRADPGSALRALATLGDFMSHDFWQEGETSDRFSLLRDSVFTITSWKAMGLE